MYEACMYEAMPVKMNECCSAPRDPHNNNWGLNLHPCNGLFGLFEEEVAHLDGLGLVEPV